MNPEWTPPPAVLVLQQPIECEIVEDAFHQDHRPVMLDEAICLVDAVEPAFRGDGTLADLLLQPANAFIVRASADEADHLR
jgi:predicted YcjX-like family ATPase